MKKLATIIAVTAGLLTVKAADAQIGIHVSFNLGTPAVVVPQPAAVQYPDYDDSDDYYYLPDVEAYYSIPQHCYFYMDGNRWISAAYLPGRYHDMDWRAFRHYEVRGERPYMNHSAYRTKFGGASQRPNWGYANNNPRGGYDQPRGYDNHNNYGQPQNNPYQNGYNQNRGGYAQPNRGNYGQPQNYGGQYPNGNNPGRDNNQQNHGNWGGNQDGAQHNNGQPSRQNGGYDRGNGNNNDHYVANRIGVTRPNRF